LAERFPESAPSEQTDATSQHEANQLIGRFAMDGEYHDSDHVR
jgi:hypothetical protein